MKDIERFAERMREIHDLQEIQGLLDWDQQVVMPAHGANQRGFHQATLARLVHDRLADPVLGAMIESLEARTDLPEDLAADVREARRARDRAVKVPAALVAERARACALAQVAWAQARRDSDFEAFRPHLETLIRLTREAATAISPRPYDALLDEYEPGATEAVLRPVFSDLKKRLGELRLAIEASPVRPRTEVLERPFPVVLQEAFARRVLEAMGYEFKAGRLDVSVHPFTSGTLGDVRITTRYEPNNLAPGLFGVMHEGGHALYEQSLDPQRFRDPSGGACSLGVHESQSRFWENVIGRSLPFWCYWFPELRRAFPGLLDDVTVEEFWRAANASRSTFIRVDADEVTYNLHVILRFELESDLVAGRLAVRDLPGAWREHSRDLLGVDPVDDRLGVLQDVHWAAGLVGYFPTYTLGNLYAAQFLEALRRDVPDLDDRLAAGDLGVVRNWLYRNVHVHGRRWFPGELCRRVTGQPLSSDAAMRYLWAKFGDVYGIVPPASEPG